MSGNRFIRVLFTLPLEHSACSGLAQVITLMFSLSALMLFMGGRSMLLGPGGLIELLSGSLLSSGRERSGLLRIARHLQETEELFSAGFLPSTEHWALFATLASPWGKICEEGLLRLRESGAPVLPTLRRLRALVQSHIEKLDEARAGSAQALVQSLACAALVPVFGVILFLLLPGLTDSPGLWAGACLLSLLWSGLGARWMLVMGESARWAGLPQPERPWVLAAECAGERFLAACRGGSPPDLAWVGACEFLGSEAADLAALWGHSAWSQLAETGAGVSPASGSTRGLLIELGHSIRRAIQVALMEGRPCTERVEGALEGFRRDFRARVDRELKLLGTRCLKPLFLFVAPPLLGLLALALFLSWEALSS